MERVIAHASDLATAHDATIHALYVVNAASHASLPMETSWEGIADLLYEQGADATAEVEHLVDDGVPVESRVVEGSPSREILAYAENEDVDLIVMGTHGRVGIGRFILGSVAERVVRNADVPVMTVSLGTTGSTRAVPAE